MSSPAQFRVPRPGEATVKIPLKTALAEVHAPVASRALDGGPLTYPEGEDWEWVATPTKGKGRRKENGPVTYLQLERAIAGAYLHCDRRIEEVQRGALTILEWKGTQFRASDVAEVIIEPPTGPDRHLSLLLVRGGETRRLELCAGPEQELRAFAGRIWSAIAAAPDEVVMLDQVMGEATR